MRWGHAPTSGWGHLPLAGEYPQPIGARHNVIMTPTTPERPRNVSPTPAYRLAVMLLGVGTTHFLAPKPFDAIVPAELPGAPRFYTYASGRRR